MTTILRVLMAVVVVVLAIRSGYALAAAGLALAALFLIRSNFDRPLVAERLQVVLAAAALLFALAPIDRLVLAELRGDSVGAYAAVAMITLAAAGFVLWHGGHRNRGVQRAAAVIALVGLGFVVIAADYQSGGTVTLWPAWLLALIGVAQTWWRPAW